MPLISTKLNEAIRDLHEKYVVPGGLYRIGFALRNPQKGIGFGMDGVEDSGQARLYGDAMESTRQKLVNWGWPEPRRTHDELVPVWVFRTERLGRGDCPLTIPREEGTGQYSSVVVLRSTIDEPRPDIRRERMAVEAAHEATHTFTHQFVSPMDTTPGESPLDGPLGERWAWFDEATAVFMEGEVFPEFLETRRFGLYWSYRPELSLTTWGGDGGYFAAWFVRFLVQEFGPGILKEIWAGAAGKDGPLEVLQRLLAERGTTFARVFGDYCCKSYEARDLAPDVAESFGPRSLTESFEAHLGSSAPASLMPLACRYYRVSWKDEPTDTPICIHARGRLQPDELRVSLLTLNNQGEIIDRTLLNQCEDAWIGTVHRPDAGAHVAVVVARVKPPPKEFGALSDVLTVRLSLGGEALPGRCPPLQTKTVGTSNLAATKHASESVSLSSRERT